MRRHHPTRTSRRPPRITEIRNTVKENVLLDPSRVTVADYKWFEQNPGVWVWEEDGLILGFSAADTRNGSIWALFMARTTTSAAASAGRCSRRPATCCARTAIAPRG